MIAKTKREFSVNYSHLIKEALEKPGVLSDCYRLFHNYSIHNQILAMYQLHGDICPINTYNGWKSMGRQVKKGQQALFLWMPVGGYSKTIKDEETGEEKKIFVGQRFMFTPRWFGLNQTEGKELVNPEKIKPLNFDFEPLYKKYGIKIVKYESVKGNTQGYANTIEKTIAINPLAKNPEKTIIHEIAHIALEHGTKRKDVPKDLKEVEAETVSYIIGSIIKLDETILSSCRAYIQGWLGENELPEKNVKKILSIANDMIKAGIKGE